jgi:hypothetical protein
MSLSSIKLFFPRKSGKPVVNYTSFALEMPILQAILKVGK